MIYFTQNQIDDIVNQYKSGKTLRDIGEHYNVSRPTIQKVLKGNYPAYTGKKRAASPIEGQTKKCSKCGIELPLSAFNRGNSLYGRRSFCRECEKEIQNTPEKRLRKRLSELRRREDPEYIRKTNLADTTRRHTREVSYKKYLLSNARKRAKEKNLEFNIDISDIIIPEKCPLLEIPISIDGKNKQASCSIDRINNSLGYVKGNVWVVSYRANMLKNNATLEEIELLAKNLRKKTNE